MSLHRVPIVLLVAAIHALLLGLLWQALHQPLPNRPISKVARTDRSQSIVFLLEPYAPAATKPRRNEPRLEDRSMPADRTHAIAAPEPVYGSEVSNAAALSSATTASVGAPMPIPMPSGPSLNLTLSRAALKSIVPGLASRSPFQGRLPDTVERKVAEAAAETGPWTEERIDYDHIRMRRGSTCITYARPQIAKIDPFNEAMGRLPWGGTVSECRPPG